MRQQVKSRRKISGTKKQYKKSPLELKWQVLLRVVKFAIRPYPFAFISIAIVFLWFQQSKYYTITVNSIDHSQNRAARSMGLILKDILLEGQQHTSKEEILTAITGSPKEKSSLRIGDPMGDIDLWGIKEKLETLTWVKHASIERQYPSTLSISISERKPVALWQNAGKITLLDEDGKVINEKNLDDFANLVILVGKDVPYYSSSLLQMLKSHPEIDPLVSSAIRVSDRRWDLRLRNGIEIKLPEENPDRALEYLAEVNKESKILTSSAKSIDLRLEEKMFVK